MIQLINFVKYNDMEISEVKVRNEFFVSALLIESMMTEYLSEKLSIKDSIDSEFLGNRATAISFSQKIDALVDSMNFSIIDKSKISVFRAIYKEFLENKNAPTLQDSFTSEDHNDDFLLILYPQSDHLPREEKLINSCYQLIGEVSELIAEQSQQAEIKIRRRKPFYHMDHFKIGKIAMMFSFLLVS